MKTLVVYYSRSGHTRQLAEEIARRCAADIEEIREAEPSTGAFGYLRSAWQALRHSEPAIAPGGADPARYDMIVIGTPVWVRNPAAPVRTWVHQHAPAIRQAAFFCTEGGVGEAHAFDELGRLCDKAPVATLAVTEKELPEPAHASQLDRFTAQLMH